MSAAACPQHCGNVNGLDVCSNTHTSCAHACKAGAVHAKELVVGKRSLMVSPVSYVLPWLSAAATLHSSLRLTEHWPACCPCTKAYCGPGSALVCLLHPLCTLSLQERGPRQPAHRAHGHCHLALLALDVSATATEHVCCHACRSVRAATARKPPSKQKQEHSCCLCCPPHICTDASINSLANLAMAGN
eukprot:1138975-Pelagomonas_calceolata.AAC.1